MAIFLETSALQVSFLQSSQLPDFVQSIWQWLQDFVHAYYSFFEEAGKLVAPIVTIGAGCYAIYQKWYFAERKLHLRLQQFLERENKRLESAQRILDEAAQRPSPALEFKSPIFRTAGLASLFRKAGVGAFSFKSFFTDRTSRAAREIDATLDELKSQLDLWDKKKIDYERKKAHAHLLKGALAAANAAHEKSSGRDDREFNLRALSEFEEALKLDPTDVQALEYIGHIKVRLNDFSSALADFSRLELT